MEKTISEHRQAVQQIVNRYKSTPMCITNSGMYRLPLFVIHSGMYRLPPAVIELLELQCITKMHAYPINFELTNTSLSAISFVSNYIGMFKPRVCVGCHHYQYPFKKCWVSKNGEMIICGICGHGQQGTIIYYGIEYIEVYVDNFDLGDWIEFMRQDTYRYYVNYNKLSPLYGDVIMIFCDVYNKCRYIGHINDLMGKITKWLTVTGPRCPQDASHPEPMQQHLLNKYGKNALVNGMIRDSMYTNTESVYFSKWVGEHAPKFI